MSKCPNVPTNAIRQSRDSFPPEAGWVAVVSLTGWVSALLNAMSVLRNTLIPFLSQTET